MSRGFQEFFGFLGGAHRSFRSKATPNVNQAMLRGYDAGAGERALHDRRVRPRGDGLHRPARQGAVVPLPDVQRRPHADARDGKVPGAVQGRDRRAAPHLLRDDVGDGRRHRRGAEEARREQADREHARSSSSATTAARRSNALEQRRRCAATRPRPGKAASACRTSCSGRARCPPARRTISR